MNKSRAPSLLFVSALLCAGASVVWWYAYFSAIDPSVFHVHGIAKEAIPCLFWMTRECGFIFGMSSGDGYFAYEPVLLWVAGVLLLAAMSAAVGAQTSTSTEIAVSDHGSEVSDVSTRNAEAPKPPATL